MGDVIDFKTGIRSTDELRVEIELDPQVRIEKCIVSYWKSLGGFDLELDEFNYLMVFMAFSDTCFTELENGNMNVHDNDSMTVKPSIHSKMEGILNGFKTTPPANDE